MPLRGPGMLAKRVGRGTRTSVSPTFYQLDSWRELHASMAARMATGLGEVASMVPSRADIPLRRGVRHRNGRSEAQGRGASHLCRSWFLPGVVHADQEGALLGAGQGDGRLPGEPRQ